MDRSFQENSHVFNKDTFLTSLREGDRNIVVVEVKEPKAYVLLISVMTLN